VKLHPYVMRILIVDKEFPPNSHGGIGSYNYSLANTLSNRGHFVSVLSCTAETKMLNTREHFGNLYRIPAKPFMRFINDYFSFVNSFFLARDIYHTLIQVIDREKIDLVEFPSVEGYGYLSAKLINDVPITTRFHGSLGRFPIDDNAKHAYKQELKIAKNGALRNSIATRLRLPMWWMEKSLVSNSALVTFPSSFSRTWLSYQMKHDFKEYPVIPNGIDLGDISKHYQVHRPTKKTILFIGRCTLPKGTNVLIRILPRILLRNNEAQVVFAGPTLDASIQSDLYHLKLKYPERVQFTGQLPREQLLELLASCYMLVHPTFYETSSMAAIESLALGIPVVTSSTGPMPEIITDRETGFLFKVGESKSLEDAVSEMLSLSDADYDSMRRACLQKAKTKFDLNLIVQELENVYSKLK
jgi:glycosyltransferase involved in cell wall biosynthesis